MPTYEYKCSACGYAFEEFQSITAEPLTVCPKCLKPSVKRLLSSGAGLVFKGSGFYLTDYKKSNSSSSSGSTSSAKNSTPAKDAKTDSTPPSGTKAD